MVIQKWAERAIEAQFTDLIRHARHRVTLMRFKYFRTFAEAVGFSKRASVESRKDAFIYSVDLGNTEDSAATVWGVRFEQPSGDLEKPTFLLSEEELGMDVGMENAAQYSEEEGWGAYWDSL